MRDSRLPERDPRPARRSPRPRSAPVRHRTALCIGLGLALLSGAAPVLAQAPASSSAAARLYQIDAGPLDRALNAFASAAGVELTVDASLLRGRRSNGLSGRFTVDEGFAALLREHGLRAVGQPNGSYLLGTLPAPPVAPSTRAPAESGATLPAVNVSASRVGDGATEGTGSYTTARMNTATRLPLSIRETPQSVTVFTHDRIEDQGLTQARDVLDHTPGITVSATSPYRESYFSRGFRIQNYMFDGLTVSTNSSRAGMFLNDLAMYDRVEVVRGAAGLTQGSGTPSAAINFVRKRPTRQFQASVRGYVGRWNYLAAEADVSGAVNEAGTLRARTVLLGSDSDSFQDVVTEKRQLAYFIAEADLGERTMLTAGLSHQRNDNITTYGGLPTAVDGGDLGLPRSAFFGNKWSYWDDQTTTLFGKVEHRLPGRWTLNFAVNQIWGNQKQGRAVAAFNDETGQWDQNGGRARVNSERTSVDLNAQGPFELFGRRHDLVIGASHRSGKEANATAGYYGYTFARGIDLRDWNHDAPQPVFEDDYQERSRDRQNGVYGTMRLRVAEPLALIVGLRADWVRNRATYDVRDFDAPTWSQSDDANSYDRHLTKYGGLVFDVDARHSVYASYTDVFLPQGERDASNKYIKPIVGKNYEVGVKGAYLGGALNVNAAVFVLDQQNLAMPEGACPFNPVLICYRPAGKVRSRGFDLEMQGALTPNWQVGAGFTRVETEVRRDADPEAVGTRLNTDLPGRLLRVSTTYLVPGSGWRVGGSVRWQSRMYHTNDWMGYTYHTEQRAYALVDAMVGYRVDRHLDFQLNASNLFDKVYYRAINTQPVQWGGNTVYGQPRRILLMARYTF